MDNHLIFYDGNCGLCHGAVRFLLNHDSKKLFLFAPLQGTTAVAYPLPKVDSIILIQNFKTSNSKILIKGKAILQIGASLYPWLTFLTFLPALLVNPPYDLVAYLRNHLFTRPDCLIPPNLDKSRFLP